MQVYSRSQNKLIEVPDEQYTQLLMQKQGGSVSAPSTTPAPTVPDMNSEVQPITGRSLKDHAMALARAKQAGDKAAIASITDDYNREYQYQNSLGKEKEMTSAEKTKLDSYNAVNNLITNLESQYQQAGGASFGTGIGARVKGGLTGISGKLGYNDPANVYVREKEGFAATLKSLTGDTGVMTQKDYERLSKLLPSLGSTPQEAQTLLNDLRSQIAAKYGSAITTTTLKPEEKAGGGGQSVGEIAVNAGKGLFNFLLGGTKKVIQDVVAGKTAKGMQQPAQQALASAVQLMDQATKTQDPGLKQQLMQQAQQIFSEVSQQQKGVASQFSENVNVNPLLRGLTVGTEVAGTTALATKAPQIFSKATKVPGSISKSIRPGKAGEALRTKAVTEATKAGKTMSGDVLHQGMVEWGKVAKQANPGKATQIDKILKEASSQFKGKSLTPEQARAIWNQVDRGFTQSGIAKTSVEASADRAMSNLLRKSLEKVAPGWEKGTQMVAKGINRGKFAKKLVIPTATGAAIGAGVGIPLSLAINKLLGKEGNY